MTAGDGGKVRSTTNPTSQPCRYKRTSLPYISPFILGFICHTTEYTIGIPGSYLRSAMWALHLALWAFPVVGFVCPLASSIPSATFHQTDHILRARQVANGVALRILPLGDSITWGFRSSDGNGYRAHLRSSLAGN